MAFRRGTHQQWLEEQRKKNEQARSDQTNLHMEDIQTPSASVPKSSGGNVMDGQPASRGTLCNYAGNEKRTEAVGCLPDVSYVPKNDGECQKPAYRYHHKTGYWKKVR